MPDKKKQRIDREPRDRDAESPRTKGGGGGGPDRDRIDDETMLLTSTAADAAAVNALLPEALPSNVGNVVQVFGADPRNRYSLRYEIRSLDDVITSNTESGAVNPDYPQELQPRDRTRAASRLQIEQMAGNLQPEALTSEFMALDRGAPIIGDDNVVESGNARTMALQRAASDHPDQYAAYVDTVRASAAMHGIDPAAVDQVANPILVRVRVDDVDRVSFAQEANTQTILGMSDTERARSDAGRLTTSDLLQFEAGESIDTDIKRAGNRQFVRGFMASIPEGERASLMDRSGELTQSGVKRIKAAMFTRVYQDPRLSDTIFEATDNELKNVTNAMMGSLGPLARSEEMVRTGQRQGDLSITGDIAAAVGKLTEIRNRGDMTVDMYLNQSNMFGDDLTPLQRDILVQVNERRRSGRQLREFFTGWATLVEREPHPQQMGMFGSTGAGKDDLARRWLSGEGWSEPAVTQSSLFG